MRRRPLIALLAAAVAIAPAVAASDASTIAAPSAVAPDAAPASPDYVPPDTDITSRSFIQTTLPPRWGELAISLIPVNIDVGMPGFTRFGEGLSIDGALIPTATQWSKLGIFVSFVYGRWSGQLHGDSTFEGGLQFRIDPLPTHIVSVYGAGRGALQAVASFGPQGDHPFGSAVGGLVGFRAFRAISIEAAGDWVHAFSADQWHMTVSGRDHFRFQAGLRFDFCGMGLDCNSAPRRTVTVDATCTLVAEARAVHREIKGSGDMQRALCNAVEMAMDRERREGEMSGDAFVDGLVAEVQKTTRADRREYQLYNLVHRLSRKHAELEACVARNRRDESEALRANRRLNKRYTYSPFPPLLRAALGCDPPIEHDPPTLQVCDELQRVDECAD